MAMRRPSPPSWLAEPPDSSQSSIDPPFLLYLGNNQSFYFWIWLSKRRRKDNQVKIGENVFLFIFSFWGRFWRIVTDDEQHGCMQNDVQSHVFVSTTSLTFIEDKVLRMFYQKKKSFENAPIPVWYGLACGTQLQLQIEMWYWFLGLIEPITMLNAFL